MSFMPSLARQGRKKSPMANSKHHPGGQQFANCEWGYPFCRRQSSFLANIPWYFSPPSGHISFHLVHFGWQATSSLRNLRGITVSSSSYTTRWQPFSSRHDITKLYLFFYMLHSRCISGTVNSLEHNCSYKYRYSNCLLEICGPSIY